MDNFTQIIDGVRSEDEQAITALVEHFEPQIRRVVRVRMLNPQLRQLIDSTDVCQSILANFFVRARDGRVDVESPTQLRRLLFTMARNKVCDWVRRQSSASRDANRVLPISRVDSGQLRDRHTGGPAQTLEYEEAVSRFRRALPMRERRIAEQRACGEPWETIAKLEGEGRSPDALRIHFFRTVNRIKRELDSNSHLE